MELNGLIKHRLFSTIMLEMTDEGGEHSLGTGTIVYQPDPEDSRRFLTIVTCRHVVENSHSMRLTWFRSKDDSGLIPDLTEKKPSTDWDVSGEMEGFKWVFHPDEDVDLAMIPYGPMLSGVENQIGPVMRVEENSSYFADSDFLARLDAASEIFFVGYPRGICDYKTQLPLARKGHLATLPQLELNDRPEFLIDASVFPGSSGSPVYSINRNTLSELAGPGVFRASEQCRLIGFISRAWTHNEQRNLEIPANVPRAHTNVTEHLDLGICVNASQIPSLFEACHKHYEGVWPS